MAAAMSRGGPRDSSSVARLEAKTRDDSCHREEPLPVEELLEAGPVFASGNAELEQRLLRTFAALGLPKCGADTCAASVAAASSSASAGHAEACLAEAAAAAFNGGPDGKRQPAGEPDATEDASRGVVRSDELAARTGIVAVAHGTLGGPVSAAAAPAADMEEAGAAAATANESQMQNASSAAPATSEHVATPTGTETAHEGSSQRQPFRRGASMARAESPGAWSEATDSTGCTDSADAVRPPAFGSWRHYSLADVPEEAMSVRGMQRACQLMLLQRRQAATAAVVNESSSSAAVDAAAADAAAADTEANDPRVRVGPRRRG